MAEETAGGAGEEAADGSTAASTASIAAGGRGTSMAGIISATGEGRTAAGADSTAAPTPASFAEGTGAPSPGGRGTRAVAMEEEIARGGAAGDVGPERGGRAAARFGDL